MMGMMRGDFSNAHGITGKILKINLPQIMVDGKDGVEKNIIIGEQTFIRQFRDEVQASDLKIGDTIVVIGAPNANGQIVATLVRVLSTTPVSATSTPAK